MRRFVLDGCCLALFCSAVGLLFGSMWVIELAIVIGVVLSLLSLVVLITIGLPAE